MGAINQLVGCWVPQFNPHYSNLHYSKTAYLWQLKNMPGGGGTHLYSQGGDSRWISEFEGQPDLQDRKTLGNYQYHLTSGQPIHSHEKNIKCGFVLYEVKCLFNHWFKHLSNQSMLFGYSIHVWPWTSFLIYMQRHWLTPDRLLWWVLSTYKSDFSPKKHSWPLLFLASLFRIARSTTLRNRSLWNT